jgi:hypothetical protein
MSFSVFPEQELPVFSDGLQTAVVIGTIGGPVELIESFVDYPGVFSVEPGMVAGYFDADRNTVFLHVSNQGSDEAAVLIAMLYVFLSSHAVVVFDSFFNVEWIRKLRVLHEMKHSVTMKTTAPFLAFNFDCEGEKKHQEMVQLLSEYRNLNDNKKRLYRMLDTNGAKPTVVGLLKKIGQGKRRERKEKEKKC